MLENQLLLAFLQVAPLLRDELDMRFIPKIIIIIIIIIFTTSQNLCKSDSTIDMTWAHVYNVYKFKIIINDFHKYNKI
jgi:hypothetical protein